LPDSAGSQSSYTDEGEANVRHAMRLTVRPPRYQIAADQADALQVEQVFEHVAFGEMLQVLVMHGQKSLAQARIYLLQNSVDGFLIERTHGYIFP
jgi:hypothetical protein